MSRQEHILFILTVMVLLPLSTKHFFCERLDFPTCIKQAEKEVASCYIQHLNNFYTYSSVNLSTVDLPLDVFTNKNKFPLTISALKFISTSFVQKEKKEDPLFIRNTAYNLYREASKAYQMARRRLKHSSALYNTCFGIRMMLISGIAYHSFNKNVVETEKKVNELATVMFTGLFYKVGYPGYNVELLAGSVILEIKYLADLLQNFPILRKEINPTPFEKKAIDDISQLIEIKFRQRVEEPLRKAKLQPKNIKETLTFIKRLDKNELQNNKNFDLNEFHFLYASFYLEFLFPFNNADKELIRNSIVLKESGIESKIDMLLEKDYDKPDSFNKLTVITPQDVLRLVELSGYGHHDELLVERLAYSEIGEIFTTVTTLNKNDIENAKEYPSYKRLCTNDYSTLLHDVYSLIKTEKKDKAIFSVILTKELIEKKFNAIQKEAELEGGYDETKGYGESNKMEKLNSQMFALNSLQDKAKSLKDMEFLSYVEEGFDRTLKTMSKGYNTTKKEKYSFDDDKFFFTETQFKQICKILANIL